MGSGIDRRKLIVHDTGIIFHHHFNENNKAGYTAQDAPVVCVLIVFENNTGQTDGPTDGPTDLRTDGHDLI